MRFFVILALALSMAASLSFAAASTSPAAASTNLQVSQLLSDTYRYDVNKTITGTALQIDAYGTNRIVVYISPLSSASYNGTNETTRLLAVLNSATKDYMFLYKKAGYDYFTVTPSFYIKDTSQFNIVKLYSDTYRYDGSNYLSGVSLKITATSGSYAIKAAMTSSMQYYSNNMLSVIDNSAVAFHHLFKIAGNDYYTTATGYTLVAITSPPINTTACIDTDGGISGYVYGSTRNSTVSRNDTCFKSQNTSYVLEWYCKGSQVYSTDVLCNYGCSNGACLNRTVSATANKIVPSTVAAKPNASANNTTIAVRNNTTIAVRNNTTIATTAAIAVRNNTTIATTASAYIELPSAAVIEPKPAGATTAREISKAASDIANSMADTSGDMYAKIMNILGVYVR